MSDITPITSQTSSTSGSDALQGIKDAVTNLNDDKAELSGATFTGAISATNLSGTHTGTSSGTNTGDQTLPVKATGAELDTGTDDAKFATAKAINDSHNVPSVAPSTSGNVMTSNGTDWVSAAPTGVKFGGTGTDGALAISSGTTTLDLGSAAYFEKNYTSISITGTGKLAFSNPHANGTTIVLKSQGAVTLTSSQAPMIDASILGGAAGASVSGTGAAVGNNGSNGVATALLTTYGSGAGSGGTPGVGGAASVFNFSNTSFVGARARYMLLPVASGGGSGNLTGSGTTATSGAGGRGGGTLIIECGGGWNFTTASGISVAGGNGGTGVGGSANTDFPNAGGGGGGGGGYFLCLYNSLTANTGTVTVSGGTGGNSDSYNSFGSRSGGAGGALLSAGSDGVGSGTVSIKTGGNGATGVSVISLNTDFA